MYEYLGAWTTIVSTATEAELADDTDGTAVSGLPGMSYGRAKRWAVKVESAATGEFNLLSRAYIDGRWGALGQGDGDVNGGVSFSKTDGGQWVVEGFSLGLAERLAFVIVIASGTPNVSVQIAPIAELV